MRSTTLPIPPLSGSLDSDFGVYIEIKNTRTIATYGGGEIVYDLGWIDLAEYENWNVLLDHLIGLGYHATHHTIHVSDLEGLCLPLFQESPFDGFNHEDMELVCSVRDFIQTNSGGKYSNFKDAVRAYLSDTHGEWDSDSFKASYVGYYDTFREFVDFYLIADGNLPVSPQVIKFLDYDKIYNVYMINRFWEDEGHYFRR
jgi:hypothetical protein